MMMPGMLGGHALVENVAATFLLVGGGAILLRAAYDRTMRSGRLAVAYDEREPWGPPRNGGASRRSSVRAVRRFETVVAAGLSLAAAAIHLAAGPGHVTSLGDLGLGFYWAALFQAAFAIAVCAYPSSRRLAWTGLGVNLALIGAWAWSRTVGLPLIGPEALGIADGTTVAFELGLMGVLTARLLDLDARLVVGRSVGAVRSVATSGSVAVLGVVLLSTLIAVADAGHGHGSNGRLDHSTESVVMRTAPEH